MKNEWFGTRLNVQMTWALENNSLEQKREAKEFRSNKVGDVRQVRKTFPPLDLLRAL